MTDQSHDRASSATGERGPKLPAVDDDVTDETIGLPPLASVGSATTRVTELGNLLAAVRSIVRVLAGVTAAMQPPRLIVGLLLAATLMATGRAWDAIASPSIPAGNLSARIATSDDDVMRPFEATVTTVVALTQQVVLGVLTIEPQLSASALVGLVIDVPRSLWQHDPLFLFGYGLVFLAVTGLFGGALARMAACDLAGAERLSVDAAITFAAKCWRSMVLAPIAPLLIAGLLWATIALLGLPLRWPWVDVAAAFLFGLALVLGILVAISLIGYAAAFPLLIPAVACERCDAGEAQQRAFAYLLQRPVRLALAMVLGIVGFGVGYFVVAGVAAVTMQVATWAVTLGADELALRLPSGYGPFSLDPAPAEPAREGTGAVAAAIVGLWRTLVLGLVAGWVFAYYYAASTSIYLTLRESTDGQDQSEIWQPGMVHGTFVATGSTDPSARRAAVERFDSQWRMTLRWLSNRRSGSRRARD